MTVTVDVPGGRPLIVSAQKVTYAGLSLRLDDVIGISSQRDDHGSHIEYSATVRTTITPLVVAWRAHLLEPPHVRETAEHAYASVRDLWVGPVTATLRADLTASRGSARSPRIGPWTFLRDTVLWRRMLRTVAAPAAELAAEVEGDEVRLLRAGQPYGTAHTRTTNALLVPALLDDQAASG